MPCAGDDSIMCGGTMANSVYDIYGNTLNGELLKLLIEKLHLTDPGQGKNSKKIFLNKI